MTPPAQRVQFILGEDINGENSHQPHPLFSEMEELTCNEDGETEWKETARYELGVKIRSMKMNFKTGGTWRRVGQ